MYYEGPPKICLQVMNSLGLWIAKENTGTNKIECVMDDTSSKAFDLLTDHSTPGYKYLLKMFQATCFVGASGRSTLPSGGKVLPKELTCQSIEN